MLTFHNRMGVVTLAVAATVLLLGAGCQKQGYQSNNGKLDQGTSTLPGATNDASGSLPTEWAEYRSEKLGITIPYPEGWYVEEKVDERMVSFYLTQPPPESDMAPNLWFDTHAESIAEFVQQLDNIEADDVVERSGIRMRRIARRDDLSDDAGLAASYLWEAGVTTHRIGGRQGDPVLEYAVDHLVVLP